MWSNRETRELHAHLAIPTDASVAQLVTDALDDVRGEPELWGDFERHALRTLSATLRSHIEGVWEEFYFGSESKRTREIARMCSDVGSLWRVNWSEIAKQLFEDSGHSLEPPE